MMQQQAPQGAGPGGPPPGQGQGPQQQGAPQKPQGPSPEQAIQMIQQGYMALGKMIGAAQGNLPPQDIKLFQMAAKATEDMIISLTGAGGGGPQQQPQPKPPGMMPGNAGRNSVPAGPQGR